MAPKQETPPPLSANAKLYIYSVNVIGSTILAACVYKVIRGGVWEWIFLAVLSSVGAFFPVKFPTPSERVHSLTFTLSDVFIYAAILLYGPYVAVVVMALDTLLGALRGKQNDLLKILFNFSSLALTTFLASKLFYYFYSKGKYPVSGTPHDAMQLFACLGVASLVWFLLNCGSVALAISLVTKAPFIELFRSNFLWSSLTNFAGAAVASLVLYLPPEKNIVYFVAVAVPIVLVFYFTYKVYLEKITEAKNHVQEMSELYHSTISSLAMAIDAKDQTTHGHVRRVQTFALGLAELAGIKDLREIEGLRAASLLHDVGKLAIPEYILNKPTALTPSEFQKMKIHPIVGADILRAVNFPFPVVPTVKHHHEKWDGSGYPDGLKAEGIPLGARILSIVDCYDALRSDRPYRAELSREIALDYIQKEAGISYDPELVRLFAENIDLLETRARQAEANLPDTVLKSIGDSVSADAGRKRRIEATVFHDIAATHKEIQAIYELSQNVGKSLNVAETMAIIASKIQNIVPYRACGIFLVDSGGDGLTCFYATGRHSEHIERLHFSTGEGVSGWVSANNQAIFNASPAADFANSRQLQNEFKSCVSVPLSIEGNLVGVITLYSEFAKNYTQDHLRLLETISRQAAVAINNSLIFEETQEDAFTDLLTGLPNSRYLYIFLEQEFRRAEKLNYPVSLLVMDLERFKSVNDTYGHQVGDRLLVEVSHILRNQMRKSDTCVRYAGDEFVAVLSGANRLQAEDNIRRIQDSVDSHVLTVDNYSVRVGISVGCATFPDDGRDTQTLIALADQHMYADKLRRTNRKIKSKPRKVISFEGRPSA